MVTLGAKRKQEDCELLYLEELISRERNQELKTALHNLDDFMCGY